MNGQRETNYAADLNPFTAIWTRPRETMRYVIEEKSSNFMFWIIVLTGFSAGVLSRLDTEQDLPGWGILLISILVGPIGGVIGLTISSGVFLLVGKLFNGEATFTEMFRALAAAQIIQIWLAPIVVLWMLLSPETYFLDSGESQSGGAAVFELIMTVILFAFSVWGFILSCKAVGEAHGLSAWKGLFIILISTAAFTVGILLLVLLIVVAL